MTTGSASQMAPLPKFSTDEQAVLAAVGIRTAEDMDSLLRSFPSIAGLGVRLPLISNAIAQRVGKAYSALRANEEAAPTTVELGAMPPPNAKFELKSQVPPPPPASFELKLPAGPPSGLPPSGVASGAPPAGAAIDLRVSPWPVRDQAHRGTCVAFGTTACVEHWWNQNGDATPDGSEQFLYWAIKDHSNDPIKHLDGTWLEFARDALNSDGICNEADWPYVPTVVSPVSGASPGKPTALAVANAAANRQLAATWVQNPGAGAANKVLNLLQGGRPVAVCLPVFQDPSMPNGPTNWTTPVSVAYGRVLNPPPTSVVVGGHCVCLTGFVADANEPSGGHFIIRNSWGTSWGSGNPDPASNAPEPGYGEVSASYIEGYCWEFLQL